ncbi:hypothetical protein Scep_023134 [Stephania cephalantha]|uniref:FAS1 domain-containing protein n=1 Tax=Stephania cephalantha TaxID=152367 RepID=A0AAP0HWY9_9MAGN
MVEMESRPLIPLFLLLQLLVSGAATTTIASATLTANHRDVQSNEQEFNIVEALASVLSDVATSPSFPTKQGATLFVPNDPNGKHNPRFFIAKRDPLVVAYHMVPRRLTYSDLRRLPAHTRLPSLLPNLFIETTGSSDSTTSSPPSDFIKIGNRLITRPDAMVSRDLVVHGIDSAFPLRAIYDYDSSLINDDAFDNIVAIKERRPGLWWCLVFLYVLAMALTFWLTLRNAIIDSSRAQVIVDHHLR